MRILRNYILRECIGPFFLSLGILTCVFLLGNLIRLANMVINKGVSLYAVGKIFLFYIPLLLGTVTWERKPWKLFALNAVYNLLNLQLIAAILTYVK